MEEYGVPLLLPQEKGSGGACTRSGSLWMEAKKVSRIAFPMIVVTAAQFSTRMMPLFMLGHLSKLSLSSASIATSIANVTGYSIVFSMASALETLCGQAYGAGQYQRVGNYTLSGIICLILVSIPISIIWLYIDKLLILIGQDPLISVEAAKYTKWLIPSLFSYAVFQSLVRYMQIQSLIMPMLISTLAAFCCQVPLCWAFIFRLKLGNQGAAIATSIAYTLNAIFLGLYVKYSSSCKKTHPASFSRDAFLTVRQFFSFAIPACLMICLAWWTYEIVVLLSGLLPNPQLETSVLSICLTTVLTHFQIPDSFGAAASTRISNELGAGKPKAAQRAFYAVLILSVSECILASMVILGCRHVLGYAFSNDREVIVYVNQIAPLLSLCIFMHGFEGVLSGIARGCGWQHVAVYINLGSYYLIALPIAWLMGFVLNLKGVGLWCGIVMGTTLVSLMLFIVTSWTNWEKQAIEARKRAFEGSSEVPNELVSDERW